MKSARNVKDVSSVSSIEEPFGILFLSKPQKDKNQERWRMCFRWRDMSRKSRD